MDARAIDFAVEDDHGYQHWLQCINALCIRFLDIELDSFPLYKDSMYQCYRDDMSPERYFTESILSELRADSGIDFIDKIVAQMCKFGPRNIGVGRGL